MAQYEYQLLQMAKGTRLAQFNERLASIIEDGWDVISMCGEEHVNVMLRRPTGQAAQQPQKTAQAQQPAARQAAPAQAPQQQRPQAPAQPARRPSQ